MKTHDVLVREVASRLSGGTIDTFVEYKQGEMDIVRYNIFGNIDTIYEIKTQGHLGRAAEQLYRAKDYFEYNQITPINTIYVSQHPDGRLKVKRI